MLYALYSIPYTMMIYLSEFNETQFKKEGRRRRFHREKTMSKDKKASLYKSKEMVSNFKAIARSLKQAFPSEKITPRVRVSFYFSRETTTTSLNGTTFSPCRFLPDVCMILWQVTTVRHQGDRVRWQDFLFQCTRITLRADPWVLCWKSASSSRSREVGKVSIGNPNHWLHPMLQWFVM